MIFKIHFTFQIVTSFLIRQGTQGFIREFKDVHMNAILGGFIQNLKFYKYPSNVEKYTKGKWYMLSLQFKYHW